ncbi:MAG: hypothetical protein PF513_07570 [Tenericutes bacterium]|jgi:hypothetical protein|nr:hypothetical protein [Mycoplasmatota bacterium]
MRKTNVFGKKHSRVRPFYAFLLVFIIIFPTYMMVNYVLEQRLDALEVETAQIEGEINQLISQHQSSEPSEITASMIYTGFESHHFDYYLRDEVILLLNMSDITMKDSSQITINTSTNNPLSGNLSDDIIIKEISITMTVDDLTEMIDFLNLLHSQEQLFYIDHLQSSLLEDGSYRIQTTIYVFYLEYIN